MMDKLISQQAAIDALCKSECGCSNAECRQKDGTDFCVTCDNVKIIKSLPSAQPEPEAISKWKKEFREYVDSLDITRDDWKGIIEYIDELPSAEPDTTTHDSIPAKTGKNDGDRTSGDCISRAQAIDALRAMQTYKLFAGDDLILVDKAQVQTELMMLPPAQPEQRWIPVTERLPLPQTLVWVTDSCGIVSVCKMSYSGIGWYSENDDWIYFLSSVIAWMPYNAPEPYQKRGEQE